MLRNLCVCCHHKKVFFFPQTEIHKKIYAFNQSIKLLEVKNDEIKHGDRRGSCACEFNSSTLLSCGFFSTRIFLLWCLYVYIATSTTYYYQRKRNKTGLHYHLQALNASVCSHLRRDDVEQTTHLRNIRNSRLDLNLLINFPLKYYLNKNLYVNHTI